MLTEAGQRLLPRIQAVLRDVEAMEQSLREDEGLLVGPLRLGMIPTVAPYLLPPLLPKLQGLYPRLDIKVRETVTATLVAELTDGALDAIIAAEPVAEPGLKHAPLFRDRFFVATATNDTDVLAAPVMEDQVALDRLLLLEEGHCLRDQALAVCGDRAERRLVNFGATSMTTLLQMVQHGMGLTLLPEIAIPAETGGDGRLAVTPFAEPVPHRDIGLWWRASSDRGADFAALAKVIRDAASAVLGRRTP